MEITTKLNVSDECYFMKDNKVEKSIIQKIITESYLQGNGIETTCKTFISYYITNPKAENFPYKYYEDEVFATKEDLLKSL